MPEVTFIITVVSLIVYLAYVYFYCSLLVFTHTLNCLLILIYNSTVSQSNSKFKDINITKLSSIKKQENHNYCKICLYVKPPRYYHCRRCNICICQMDHHCQWLNCCVGQFNFKVFLHILLNLLILGLAALIDVFMDKQAWLSSSKILRLIGSGFLIWQVQRMIISSFQYISHNQTLIETYKGVKGPRKSILDKMKQIFGCSPNFSWLLPTFADQRYCNIWQPVLSLKSKQVIDLTFADQYLYGEEDEDDKLIQVQIKQK